MAPTQADFVRAVMGRLNVTQSQLGRLLGYPQSYQDAHRLIVGGRNLSYEDTMELLSRCGWLTKAALDSLAKAHLDEATLAAEQAADQAKKLRRQPPNGQERHESKR